MTTKKEHYEVRVFLQGKPAPLQPEWNALNRKSCETMLLLLKKTKTKTKTNKTKNKKKTRSRLIPCIEDDKERSVFITNICLRGKMLILPYL